MAVEEDATDRREGGGVDGEEGDLVDLGPENGDLRTGGGESEPAIAGRELLGGVVEEVGPRSERYGEAEPVRSLHGGVRARRVHAVRVVRLNGRQPRRRGEDQHGVQQEIGGRPHGRSELRRATVGLQLHFAFGRSQRRPASFCLFFLSYSGLVWSCLVVKTWNNERRRRSSQGGPTLGPTGPCFTVSGPVCSLRRPRLGNKCI